MSKEQFVALFKHELAGMYLDALYTGKAKHGVELSLFVSTLQATVADRLAKMYDALHPNAVTPTVKPETPNGKPAPAPAVAGRVQPAR